VPIEAASKISLGFIVWHNPANASGPTGASMPPLSYISIAIVLAALVVSGEADRLGYSVSLWYDLFYVTVSLLAIPGAIRITRGLHARFWVGIALASPGLVCGAINLYNLYELPNRLYRPIPSAFYEVAYLALLAAAAAAIHLAEKISGRRTAYRVAYWILAIAAVTTCLNWLAHPMGWRFTQDFGFASLAWTANTAAMFVKYGAFISAAMLVVIRRDIELWAGIVISLISAYLLYSGLRPLFVDDGFAYNVGLMFWVWPAVMLVGAAAVWRMGALLDTSFVQARSFNSELNTISNEIPASNEIAAMDRPGSRPFVSRGVAIYFGVLFVLTFIAFLRDSITIAMFMFIVPAFILMASPTLLYYSTAALPAYFVNRYSGNRVLAVTIAVASLTCAAVLPHYIGWYLLERLVVSGHSDSPYSLPPRSFELPFPEADNYWTNWRRPESHLRPAPPPCTDLCQQLLFRGHAEAVFIRGDLGQDPMAAGKMVITGGKAYRLTGGGSVQEIPARRTLNSAEFFKPKWRRFRLEQRETCPDTMSLIEGQFVRDVVGGRCLVEDTVDRADADVILSISKSPPIPVPRREGPSIALQSIQSGPMTVAIKERRDQQILATEVKTALEGHYAPLPFYFGVKFSGLSSNIVVATDRFSSSVADPFEMIRRRYGLPIDPIPSATRLSIPVSDDDRSAVKTILGQDYGQGGYVPVTSSRLVTSFVNSRLKSGQLNEDDLAIVRALLKQHAFTGPIEPGVPPSTYQALKPLLPDIFERIADRSDGQNEMVQSLNVMLDQFSVEDTDPYSLALCREKKNGDLRVCYKREFRNTHKN
jgi:hypothetical protein